jgi:hypothetical protein
MLSIWSVATESFKSTVRGFVVLAISEGDMHENQISHMINILAVFYLSEHRCGPFSGCVITRIPHLVTLIDYNDDKDKHRFNVHRTEMLCRLGSISFRNYRVCSRITLQN